MIVDGMNCFESLALLLRDLRGKFLAEAGLLKDSSLLKPHTGELLGQLNSLIKECEDMKRTLNRVEAEEQDLYAAFVRAQKLVD